MKVLKISAAIISTGALAVAAFNLYKAITKQLPTDPSADEMLDEQLSLSDDVEEICVDELETLSPEYTNEEAEPQLIN